MDPQLKVFISYKTSETNNRNAANLARDLHDADLEVFLDKVGMIEGHKWPQIIYDNVVDSDILLVLLTPEVINSDWVRREVDLARGAHIAVLPVLVEGDNESANTGLRTLGLDDYQYFDYRKQLPEQIQSLVQRIQSNVQLTREAQSTWIMEVHEREDSRRRSNPENRPAPTNLHYRKFEYVNQQTHHKHHTGVVLATGNIVEMKNIDVIVNSENAYMQMARFFETRTVSASIRQAGIENIGLSFIGDDIQDQLDVQIKTRHGSKTPIDWTRVIATTSGSERGVLFDENRVRYVLHVATLYPGADGNLEKIRNVDLVKKCVERTLEKVIEIDKSSGNLFIGSDRKQYADIDFSQTNTADDYLPIKSIVFPLLATGTGGLETRAVIEAMLDGVIKFLDKYPDTKLDSIHIAAYLKSQVAVAEQVLAEHHSFLTIS